MGYYDEETYDEYNGTYVQDVEGWRVVDIPVGYWCINELDQKERP